MPSSIEGNFSASINIEFPGWGSCNVGGNYHLEIVPTNTPAPPPTAVITNTPSPAPTNTPAPTATIGGPGD